MRDDIKAIISDMDGVLWRGAEALPGLKAFFDLLHARGMPYILATNNSSNTPGDYARKLAKFGVAGVNEDCVITSGTATARWLQAAYPGGARVHVIGGAGLKRILCDAGFTLVDERAQIVVCGIDFELTYDRAKRATLLIREGARFIGTNPDPSFPSPEGLVPGAGSIIAMIATATGTTPTIIGKPERGMFDVALRLLGTKPAETLMIGDRIGTDIQGAAALGIKTALVMTGVETETSLAFSEIQPDFVFSGLPTLVAWLKGADG